jgi:hypothetical protein
MTVIIITLPTLVWYRHKHKLRKEIYSRKIHNILTQTHTYFSYVHFPSLAAFYTKFATTEGFHLSCDGRSNLHHALVSRPA